MIVPVRHPPRVDTQFRLTRAEVERDTLGWCGCGLTGRQRHHRVSRPGEKPELYVRGQFTCRASGLGIHERADCSPRGWSANPSVAIPGRYLLAAWHQVNEILSVAVHGHDLDVVSVAVRHHTPQELIAEPVDPEVAESTKQPVS
jgi:hypothetical protein